MLTCDFSSTFKPTHPTSVTLQKNVCIAKMPKSILRKRSHSDPGTLHRSKTVRFHLHKYKSTARRQLEESEAQIKQLKEQEKKREAQRRKTMQRTYVFDSEMVNAAALQDRILEQHGQTVMIPTATGSRWVCLRYRYQTMAYDDLKKNEKVYVTGRVFVMPEEENHCYSQACLESPEYCTLVREKMTVMSKNSNYVTLKHRGTVYRYNLYTKTFMEPHQVTEFYSLVGNMQMNLCFPRVDINVNDWEKDDSKGSVIWASMEEWVETFKTT